MCTFAQSVSIESLVARVCEKKVRQRGDHRLSLDQMFINAR